MPFDGALSFGLEHQSGDALAAFSNDACLPDEIGTACWVLLLKYLCQLLPHDLSLDLFRGRIVRDEERDVFLGRRRQCGSELAPLSPCTLEKIVCFSGPLCGNDDRTCELDAPVFS